jgi:hypothetical protein
MNSVYESLEPAIQDHLKIIRETSGLPDSDTSLELLAEGFKEKESAFDEQTAALGMERVEECEDPRRGFLALTYSGSLVAVGPADGGRRRAVYVSIDRRKDVPSRAESENSAVEGTVSCGREIVFRKGPVKKSSAVYRLALLPSALAIADQHDRLDEATVTLTREFQAVDGTGFHKSQ